MHWSDLMTLLQLCIGFNFGFGAFSQVRDQIFVRQSDYIAADWRHLSQQLDSSELSHPGYKERNSREVKSALDSFLQARSKLEGAERINLSRDDKILLLMLASGVLATCQLAYATIRAGYVPTPLSVFVAGISNLPWIMFLGINFVAYLNVRREVGKHRQDFEAHFRNLPAR